MKQRSHTRPSEEGRRRRVVNVWTVGTPIVIMLSGALFAVSGSNSEGTDLRPGRYTDLSSVATAESNQVHDLQDDVKRLQQQIDRLTEQNANGEVKAVQQRVNAVEDPAGLSKKEGSGVRIVLSDAPTERIEAYSGDPNDLLVHQQDIQAVVNALWRGGAEAVTIEGQRVITTTGIKCSGSTVQLQGVPYPAPYEIEAIGDMSELVRSIDSDPYIAGYRRIADDPEHELGWSMTRKDQVVAPAFGGVVGMRYAEAIGDVPD